MEIIIVIGIVVLAIYFKRKYDYSKITPEQKHIKRSLEDPQYAEDFHRQMEEGRKIKKQLDKEDKEMWDNTFGGKLKESSTDDNAEQKEVTLTQDLIDRMNNAEQIEVSEEKIKELREIRERIKKDEDGTS